MFRNRQEGKCFLGLGGGSRACQSVVNHTQPYSTVAKSWRHRRTAEGTDRSLAPVANQFFLCLMVSLDMSPEQPSPRRLSLASEADKEECVDEAGYLHVAVRVRPLDARRGAQTQGTLQVDLDHAIISNGDHRFGPFAHIFSDSDCTNEHLFHAVGKHLVLAATQGYNGTLFTYGQTGSGKTYTMGESSKLGTEHEGVGHRIVRELYDTISRDVAHTYQVEISFVQVYVERIYDLLADRVVQYGRQVETALSLHEDKTHGVRVAGAKRLAAKTVDEALALMRSGQSRLAFASTNMNQTSSRSHSVCMLHVMRSSEGDASGSTSGSSDHAPSSSSSPLRRSRESMPTSPSVASPRPGFNLARWRHQSMKVITEAFEQAQRAGSNQLRTVTHSKISLVDLAGSEDVGRSGATGLTLAEAKKINTSLLALGNVIASLTREGGGGKGERHGHVPYRSSVLTRLLSDSIGGNCKTTLVCCASPADADLTETLSTLRFAARAKLVRNHARVNESVSAMENAVQAQQARQWAVQAVQRELDSAHTTLRGYAARCLQFAVRARREKETAAAHAAACKAAEAALARAHEAAERERAQLQAHDDQARAHAAALSAAAEVAEGRLARALAERAAEATAAARKLAASSARARELEESLAALREEHAMRVSEAKAACAKEVHEVKARLADEAQQRREVERETERAAEQAAHARVTELTRRDEAEAALRATVEELRAQAVRLQAEAATARDEATAARAALEAERSDTEEAAEKTKAEAAQRLASVQAEAADLRAKLAAAREEGAVTAAAAERAAAEASAREVAMAVEFERAQTMVTEAKEEVSRSGLALKSTMRWQSAAQQLNLQEARARAEAATRAQALSAEAAQAAQLAAVEAAKSEREAAVAAARREAAAEREAALSELRTRMQAEHAAAQGALRAALEAERAAAVEAAEQAIRDEAELRERSAAQRAARELSEAVAEAREQARERAIESGRRELESRLQGAVSEREAALAKAQADGAVELAKAVRAAKAEAEAAALQERKEIERAHQEIVSSVRVEVEATARAKAAAAKAEAEAALATAVSAAREQAEAAATAKAEARARIVAEEAAAEKAAEVSAARTSTARAVRAEAERTRREEEEAHREAMREASQQAAAAAEAEAKQAAAREAEATARASRKEVEAAATAELSAAMREAEAEADRRVRAAAERAEAAKTTAVQSCRAESERELRSLRAEMATERAVALEEARAEFSSEREELKTELRELAVQLEAARKEHEQGASREAGKDEEIAELRDEVAQVRAAAQRQGVALTASLKWRRASAHATSIAKESASSARSTAAAAREEALAAEVKELNRTVGRLRREASEARRRRLCDVSYETRLKQQKENRASSPPTVHLSLRDVDEDWHQQTNDPGRSDGAYERAMSHYVARLNDAERNELEYYRSLSSFSF